MSYQHKVNSGSMFVNDEKKKPEHPDRQGSINVEGKLYWISGWLKQDKNGNPFLSLAVRPQEKQPEKPAPRKPYSDDTIPF